VQVPSRVAAERHAWRLLAGTSAQPREIGSVATTIVPAP
jgi:hypothetical protein